MPYNSSSSVNANTTPYNNRLQSLSGGDSKPYQAPRNIYGGQSSWSPFPNVTQRMERTVQGANLQSDIPGHTPNAGFSGGIAGSLAPRPVSNPSYRPNVSLVRPAVADTPATNTTAPQTAQTAKRANPGDAFQLTKSAGDSLKVGDGGPHDQIVDQSIQRVNSDLQRVYSSENPDAIKQEIANDPWYSSQSLWKGIFNAAAATYDGANVSEALKAGQEGIAQGEQEDTRNKLKENAIANNADLLQYYTGDSVAAYQQTGDASLLREKKMTLAEIDARAEADKQDERKYEESLYQRKRRDELEDRAAAGTDQKGRYKYNKDGTVIDTVTGQITQTAPNGNNEGPLPPKGSLSKAEYNNEVVTNGGLDPYTRQPLKPAQVKASADWDKGRQAFESTMSGAATTLDAVRTMLSPDHETDFNSAFGSVDSRLPTTRAGTANMESALKTVTSASFLESVKSMRGLGALSDAEGAKLVAAIGNLDPKLPQKTLRDQLGKIQTHLENLQKAATKEAGLKGYTGGSNVPEGAALDTGSQPTGPDMYQ